MRKLSSILVIAGILHLPLYAGCEKPGVKPVAHSEPAAGGDQHVEAGHPKKGPHGGQLIELGNEEYHAELVHDEKAHRITIYVLDSAGKQSVPTAPEPVSINLLASGKPAQFSLPSVRQESDPAGKSSRFEVVDEKLCEAMDGENAKARLNITIAGKAFVGSMEHHDHAGHKD